MSSRKSVGNQRQKSGPKSWENEFLFVLHTHPDALVNSEVYSLLSFDAEKRKIDYSKHLSRRKQVSNQHQCDNSISAESVVIHYFSSRRELRIT